MSKDKVNVIADLWAASISATVAVAEKVPSEKRMKQLQSGKSHPTWLLGHLSYAASFPVLGVSLGNAPLMSAEWMPLFAPGFNGGQPIQSEESTYPSWDEIVDGYKKTGDAVVGAIRNLDDSDLDGGVKGSLPENAPDAVKAMFTNLGQVLLMFAGHNTHHTGQLALIAALD